MIIPSYIPSCLPRRGLTPVTAHVHTPMLDICTYATEWIKRCVIHICFPSIRTETPDTRSLDDGNDSEHYQSGANNAIVPSFHTERVRCQMKTPSELTMVLSIFILWTIFAGDVFAVFDLLSEWFEEDTRRIRKNLFSEWAAPNTKHRPRRGTWRISLRWCWTELAVRRTNNKNGDWEWDVLTTKAHLQSNKCSFCVSALKPMGLRMVFTSNY